ncbi:MAG: sulfotransferase [Anaerolineales bacterium]|nr:sulfotransferase [Anaerolineales bacterium]
MTLPNFLVIGAAKAGTTALHSLLRQHPQIFLPTNKEPGYFAYHKQHPSLAGPGDQEERVYLVLDMLQYQKIFASASSFHARGEATTAYLYHPQAAENICQILPSIKLIAILRNPVDRAYSSFLQMVRDGREPLTDFRETLKVEAQRIKLGWGQIWHYRQMGYYGKQLKRYYAQFPNAQIRVFLYDEFLSSPEQVLRKIFNFLEVDDTFLPDIRERINVSGVPRNQPLYALLTRKRSLRIILRHIIPYSLRKFLNRQLSHWPLAKPPLAKDIRKSLMEDFYDDLLELQKLIDKDISPWLTL